MNWLKNLTLGICSLSVIYTLMQMLVPQRYQKQMKTVVSLLFGILIGSMIIGLDVSDLNAVKFGAEYSLDVNEHDRLVILQIEEEISKYLESEIHALGITPEKVRVKTNIDESMCISIIEARVVLDSKDEFASDSIKKLIAQRIGDIDVYFEFSEE